jgi:hypothetical protein
MENKNSFENSLASDKGIQPVLVHFLLAQSNSLTLIPIRGGIKAAITPPGSTPAQPGNLQAGPSVELSHPGKYHD